MRLLRFLKHTTNQLVSFNWSGPGPKWFGPGTLTLAGNNNFTTPPQMVGGTLKAGGPGCFGQDGLDLTIPAGVTLDTNGNPSPQNRNLYLAGTVVNTGVSPDLNQEHFPRVYLDGDSTIIAGSNGVVLSSLTVNSYISSRTYTLRKLGSGTLYLNNLSFTGSGKLDIQEGIVESLSTNSHPQAQLDLSTMDVNVEAGARLNCGPFLSWVGKRLTGGGTVQIAGGTHDTYIGSDESSTFGGTFTGGDSSGRLVQIGNGTTTLAASVDSTTMLAKLYLRHGTIQYANASSLGAPTGGSGTSAPIQFVGGTLQQTSICTWPSGLSVNVWDGYGGTWDFSGLPNLSTQSIPAAIGLGWTLNMITAPGRTTQLQGIVSGAGTLNITGGGTVEFSAANTSNGTVSINGGSTVSLTTAYTLANDTSVNLDSTSTLKCNNLSQRCYSLAGSGTVDLGSSSQLNVGYGSNSTTFSGVFLGSGNAAVIKQTGSGILTLTGDSGYSFVRWYFAGGAVSISDIHNLGGYPVSELTGTSAPLQFVGGSLKQTAVCAWAYTNTINAQSAGGTLDLSALTADQALPQKITLTGTLTINNPAACTVNSGGIISGTGSLTKTGAGTLTLNGANTYRGATNINAGTLSANNAKALGSTSALNLSNGNLSIGAFAITSLALTCSGTSTVTVASGGSLTLNGAKTFNTSSTTTINGSGTVYIGSNTNSSGAGNVVINGWLWMNMSGGTHNRTGTTTINPGAIVTSTTLLNFFGTGAVTINGGTFGSGNANGRSWSNAIIVDGDFAIGGGSGQSTGAITLTGPIDLGGSTRTITTIAPGIMSGVISNGGVIKAGASTLTISGINTYTGTTTVSAGTLTVSNASALGTGDVSVNGTLTYTVDTTGTRTVTVNADGVINKGGFTHTGTTFINNGGIINP